jgi:hypothetical protein
VDLALKPLGQSNFQKHKPRLRHLISDKNYYRHVKSAITAPWQLRRSWLLRNCWSIYWMSSPGSTCCAHRQSRRSGEQISRVLRPSRRSSACSGPSHHARSLHSMRRARPRNIATPEPVHQVVQDPPTLPYCPRRIDRLQARVVSTAKARLAAALREYYYGMVASTDGGCPGFHTCLPNAVDATRYRVSCALRRRGVHRLDPSSSRNH